MAAPEGSPQGRSLDLPGRRATGGRGPPAGRRRAENIGLGSKPSKAMVSALRFFRVFTPLPPPECWLAGISRRLVTRCYELLPLNKRHLYISINAKASARDG